MGVGKTVKRGGNIRDDFPSGKTQPSMSEGPPVEFEEGRDIER